MLESILASGVEIEEHMDEANRKAIEFMETPDGFSPEDVFSLFCEAFDLTEDEAAAYLNGYQFDIEENG